MESLVGEGAIINRVDDFTVTNILSCVDGA